MTFERIVRPFQTVQISPVAQRGIIAPDEPLENVILEFGREGKIKDISGSSSASSSSFTKEDAKETTRETTERRVENPDDPTQYVNVEDTNKIGWESGKKDTYKDVELEFKPADTP